MIEGIIVTLTGNELKKLCKECATHHRKRAKVYADQIKTMKKNQIEVAQHQYSGDPFENLKSRLESHTDDASEMEFIAEHLDLKEKYRLERRDLERLHICKSSRWQ